MKTSVIIPSYHPSLKLAKTLDSLSGQNKLIDELILVVDKRNYTENGNSILQHYSDKFHLKIISQEVSGRGRSRNAGANASEGDLLIFLDDDMLAEDNLISKHIQYHLDYPGIIVFGNGFRNPNDANYDFGKYLIKMELSWKKNSGQAIDITLKNFSFTASNMSIPKDIFQQLNGFDTRFPDGEDFDLGVRAVNQGTRIIYDISLLAWHNDWPDIRAFAGRQVEYTNAKKIIAEIHPDYTGNFQRMFQYNKSKIKKTVAVLFNPLILWFVTSGNFIFVNLPLKTKFRLYKLTLAVNSVANSM